VTVTESPAAGVCELDFAEYVADRRHHLLRAAYAITRSRDTAEDLLQSALAGAFAHWSTIRDHRTASGYIRRAMVNTYISWSRQKWRSQEYATAEPPERPTSATPSVELPSDRQPLWSLVTALPPRQRATVVLRYYEGLSGPEVAAVLGCSIGTVKSSTSRGLATLRRLASHSEAL
jgi:RNA polymerase sigma-70 factor (sigma-E family)